MGYYDCDYGFSFSDLKGRTMTEVKRDGDEIHFTDTEGNKYVMYHSQSCCESVGIEDICGDLQDLVGAEILMAEEATNDDPSAGEYGIGMWTFYKLATHKGYVDIRWYGSSNGYYSVSVDFLKLNK